MTRLYPRELVIGTVLGTVTSIIVSAAVLSSPALADRLGVLSTGWVNGMLVVELVRMCLVAGLTLVMIRQRHGFERRGLAALNAIGVGLGTWLALTTIGVGAALVTGGASLGWGLVTNLVVWTAGAVLAAIFVSPGGPSRERNHYLERLDRERTDGAWS